MTGGSRRSIGRSDEVAELVCGAPEQFSELINCLWDDDPVVAMRAADAAEKVSRTRPGLLQPPKRELLRLLNEATRQELRWHLAMQDSTLKPDVLDGICPLTRAGTPAMREPGRKLLCRLESKGAGFRCQEALAARISSAAFRRASGVSFWPLSIRPISSLLSAGVSSSISATVRPSRSNFPTR
jgi:hypothetical protein